MRGTMQASSPTNFGQGHHNFAMRNKAELEETLRQHRTIPALRLKHRSGGCGTASVLSKCSIMSGCGTPHRASGAKAPRTLRPLPLLRFAVSATGGAHLCSIQYYLRFWLSICRTSLAVSALRIMRYCLYNFTSISPAPESDCPSPLSPNRAYRSSSSAPPPQNKRACAPLSLS